jgi:hypothetical protein|tara:strand:+ start:348 stop:818 length:471 start_codon:yes stop_codon:yes gene_type:complete
MKKNNYKYLYISIILILLNSCGFKPISSQNSYKITEVQTVGEKKINYILKNKLITNIDNDSQRIELKINTKKDKNIKEKNIRNEIVKYTIAVSTDVTINFIDENKINTFNITISGDFDVAENYSQTINNEKNLITQLSNEITNEINRKLLIKINDL